MFLVIRYIVIALQQLRYSTCYRSIVTALFPSRDSHATVLAVLITVITLDKTILPSSTMSLNVVIWMANMLYVIVMCCMILHHIQHNHKYCSSSNTSTNAGHLIYHKNYTYYHFSSSNHIRTFIYLVKLPPIISCETD